MADHAGSVRLAASASFASPEPRRTSTIGERDALPDAVSTSSLVSRLAGRDKRELDEIADALRRLGTGAYGLCGSCRKPIALARLRAVPATRWCLHCQAGREAVP